MKRLISVMLILLLMLCGCQIRGVIIDEQPPQPVYDESPVSTGAGITVNGIMLSGIYAKDGTEYINLKEYADAVGKSFSVTEGIKKHSATLDGVVYYTGRKEKGDAEGIYGSVYDGSSWYHPLAELIGGYHELIDAEKNHRYYTAYPLASQIPTGVKVPMFMYHAVSDDLWGIESLFVSPSRLEEQLKYITENGYTPIFFEDLEKADSIEKPIILTFDDGYQDNYLQLFPLLKKYNVKATVFMIMGSVNAPYHLTQAQIKEMNDSGLVSFQSHTITHEFLSTRNAEQLDYELGQSKIELARITGKEPFVICYPSGRYSSASIEACKKYYQFGLIMSGPTYVTGSDPFMCARYFVSRSTTLSQFKNMLQ